MSAGKASVGSVSVEAESGALVGVGVAPPRSSAVVDLGRQDIPVLVAERFRDQFQGFAVGGFDRPWLFRASRRARAMAFASRKSRMRTPLHRRTEEIGACLADPFANGEGRIELIRSPSPKGAGGGCIDPGDIVRNFD